MLPYRALLAGRDVGEYPEVLHEMLDDLFGGDADHDLGHDPIRAGAAFAAKALG